MAEMVLINKQQRISSVSLSSFSMNEDMFRNYAHRAEVFAATVAAIADERGEFDA